MTTTTKPTVRIEQVTPEMADKYLGTMVHNRQLRQSRVVQWLSIIERGQWELTNDAISFDENGHLLNGQHRLAAIATSGRTLPLVVLRNLPPRVQDVMDSGLTRKLADALKLREQNDTHVKASALRWIHRLEYIEAHDGELVTYANKSADIPTIAELLTVFDAQAEAMSEVSTLARRAKHELSVPEGGAMAIMIRQRAIDPDEQEAFWETTLSGAGLEVGDARLALRNYLLAPIRGGHRRRDYQTVAIAIKAWNHWRDGNSIMILRWAWGGLHSEQFPIPY